MLSKGKVRDALELLRKDGWLQVRQTGSHRHFRHPTKRGLVTVPGRPADDLPVGTWKSVMRQAMIDDSTI
jgi:predicted RNA binding protein YcfA (HicA-like mRNA interferase family)